MHMRNARTAALAAGAALALSSPLLATSAQAADLGDTPPADLSDGSWVPYDGDETGADLRPTLTTGCPAGTTNYTGAQQPYSCLYIDVDASGYQVGVRQGVTGDSGFGILHATEHGLDEHDIELILQDTYGTLQSSASQRYVYGETFYTPSGAYVSVEVIVARTASTAAPDSYDLGLITAYCREGSQVGPMEDCPADLPAPFGG